MRCVVLGVVCALGVVFGDEKEFDADVDAWWNSDVPPTMSTLRDVVERHLAPSDRHAFKAATGGSVDALLSAIEAFAANSSVGGGDVCGNEAPAVVMSTKKFVRHPLNAQGLHAFRALVADRVMHRLLAEAPIADARASRWRQRLREDGYVSESFDATLVAARDGALELPAGLKESLQDLFKRDFEGAILGGDWEAFAAEETDKQIYLHVDTYMPTFKVWVFANTSRADGPLRVAPRPSLRSASFSRLSSVSPGVANRGGRATSARLRRLYVRGSHRSSSAHKLRWLFRRTKHLRPGVPRPKVSDATYGSKGPFAEAAFGFEASLRYEGFDPRDPKASYRALSYFGFEAPTPLLAEPGEAVLVVADTSGLHARGLPDPGHIRKQLLPTVPRLPQIEPNANGGWTPRPSGEHGKGEAVGGGRNCAPRRNVFHCERHPPDCLL